MYGILLLYVFCLPAGLASDNVTAYDPSELLSQIFNSNDTQQRGGYGLIFDENYSSDVNPNPVVFGDGGGGFQANLKKKRRRKPKKTLHQYVGGYINNGDSFYTNVPRPSLAAQALSSITEALTSIAKYDDYQCVPRLLCEASGGMGSQALPSVPGLESLLTLLSAYTGVTSNPLFVFGRAVYLGVSSQGNPASCRYAYPQCPTDAEKLVHYLNNHNGGFFRFFNSPQQQQNLNQFYQNYQQPPHDQNIQLDPYPQSAGQYGFYKPNLYENQQGYGSAYNYNRYKTSKIQKRIQNRPYSNAGEDVIDDAKWTFPEGNSNFENEGFYVEDGDFDNSFKFPERNKNDRKTRGFAFPGSFVKKPSYIESTNNNFIFPNQNNVYNDDRVKDQEYNEYVKEQKKYQDNNNKHVNEQNYYHKDVLNDNHNFYNNRVPVFNNYNNNKYEDNLQTVYVVRGNGDPSRPEIVKLKPGQSIKDL